MGAKSWIVALGLIAVIAVVAGVVEWNEKKQAEVAARELANAPPPMPATVDAAPVVASVGAPVVAPMAAPVATVAPAPAPVPVPVVSQEERQEQAEALDASTRAMREDTIAVQKRLREEEAARRADAEAPKDGERCIGGQKMKRVQNGWVQAGEC